MIKLFHEMPLAMLLNGFEENITDGHYALVHLYKLSKPYYNYTVSQLKKGRDVILDNSIFELGKAFDADEFAEWIEAIAEDTSKEIVNNQLTYIIPDVLDDTEATINSAEAFLLRHGNLPGRKMAVAQGTSLAELASCYINLNKLAKLDRTGISFNCEAYNTHSETSMLRDWMVGRQTFVKFLTEHGMIKSPLHLLGCSLPQEFKAYKGMKEIVSIDTSNPVVHGLYKQAYTEEGLNDKLSIKLIDLFYRNPDIVELATIEKNCTIFRGFVNE